MLKRLFDIAFSLIGLVLLFPFFVLIAILIKIGSKGPVFFRQVRVGEGNKDFILLKFRTMYIDSDKQGLLTIGKRDSRVTNIGYLLRKFKLDELPQLGNILKGEMSFVGPRPEVRKYVDMYDERQRTVLNVKPGLTDIASIKYKNENELLAGSQNPEQVYINEIMPHKILLNLKYIETRNIFKDFKVVFMTLMAVLKR